MKPTFAKLGLKIVNEVKTININDQEIQVKQYLPVNEKLMLMSDVINLASDENNFANPVKIKLFTKLEVIFYYTNLTFTDKQKEDLVKLYDILESNKIFEQIFAAMNSLELQEIQSGVLDCANAFYAYKNSVLGILDVISADYGDTKLNIDEMMASLDQPDKVGLLRDVLANLG